MANEQNLQPFTGADDPRRQNGRRKGSKNLATIIRELESEDFDWSILPTKDNEKLQAFIDQVAPMGSPFRAIVMKMVMESLNGNTKAAEWLRKAGYGDKLDVTSKGKTIAPKVVSVIKPYVRAKGKTSDSDRSDQ